MTKRDIASLACRIIAVYLFTEAALSLSGGLIATLVALGTMMSELRWEFLHFLQTAIYIVPGIGMAIAGWILWIKSERVAQLMVADDSTFVVVAQLTAADILSIALSISGVFMFVDSIQHLVRNLALITQEKDFSYWKQTPSWNQALWSAGIEFAFSLWLIFGSRGIASIIRKLRHQDPSMENINPPQE